MINLFTFGAVALVFGGSRFLSNVSVEQKYLVFIAILMTVVGLLFISVPLNAGAFNIGLPAGIILIMYVLGMWFIYKKKPDDENSESDEIQTTLTLTKAWLLFGVVSVGVVVGGIFLAISTDQIADITGISSGVLGIIAVSIVTTMPEASATIAAARMKAYDLGVAGLFGSCVFNVTIIGYADIFYRDGIITTQGEPAHQIAGLVAVGLMLIGLAVILGKNKLPKPVLTAGVAAIVVVYLVGAVLVATNG
tara:strand:- start:1216 stop:1965 length:750 start_codon:yes stop_codon:yes gene_type:complete